MISRAVEIYMKENYIKKVLETLKNEGDIEITF